jgi:hypothetical protein
MGSFTYSRDFLHHRVLKAIYLGVLEGKRNASWPCTIVNDLHFLDIERFKNRDLVLPVTLEIRHTHHLAIKVYFNSEVHKFP